MGRDWKQWVKDKGLEKWFRRDNFIVLVLAGILLFIVALPVKDKDEGAMEEKLSNEEKAAEQTLLSYEALNDAEQSGVAGQMSKMSGTDEDYVAYLEKRLTDSLSQMADVGKVKVMITLKESGELVLEKDSVTTRSDTEENDGQGGSRTISEATFEENTIYSTEGAYSEPYVVKVYAPKIEGVLVVAQGAGSGTVNRTIVTIVQALFGVEAHKVKVVKMD